MIDFRISNNNPHYLVFKEHWRAAPGFREGVSFWSIDFDASDDNTDPAAIGVCFGRKADAQRALAWLAGQGITPIIFEAMSLDERMAIKREMICQLAW